MIALGIMLPEGPVKIILIIIIFVEMDYYLMTLQALFDNKIQSSVCNYSVLYTLYNNYNLPWPRASGVPR